MMMSLIVRRVDGLGKREKMECTCVKVRSIVICCMVVRDRGCFEEVEWKGETA